MAQAIVPPPNLTPAIGGFEATGSPNMPTVHSPLEGICERLDKVERQLQTLYILVGGMINRLDRIFPIEGPAAAIARLEEIYGGRALRAAVLQNPENYQPVQGQPTDGAGVTIERLEETRAAVLRDFAAYQPAQGVPTDGVGATAERLTGRALPQKRAAIFQNPEASP